MDSAIRVEQLKKCFGSVTALDGVDFSVPTGSVLVLGPNSAGKTTVRILTTILKRDGSVAEVRIDVGRTQAVREPRPRGPVRR
jgi:ABC-type multidrug transport system ATPase subunit